MQTSTDPNTVSDAALTRSKRTRVAQHVAPMTEPEENLSAITKRAPLPPRGMDEVQVQEKPAGVYRVIHGNICVPRPRSLWTRMVNGVEHEIPGVERTEYARQGDEVRLTDVDATNAFSAGLIEELDAKPSMVGKGWKDAPKDKDKGRK